MATSLPARSEGSPPYELGEFVLQCKHNMPVMPDGDDVRSLLQEISQILTCIKLGAKVVIREISRANTFGLDSATPIPGSDDLAAFAAQRFLDALVNRRVVAGVAMEPMDTFVSVPNCENRRLVAVVHPMDGTKQVDTNVSTGTIFSIYRRVSPVGDPVKERDFLQPGKRQLCAGYVIYGSSTMLVCTLGNGVHGFTVDPSLGTFYMSHPNIRIPEDGKIFSLNGGKRRRFPRGVVEFIDYCQENALACRYIGSLVADFHRNMLKGGIFIYPPTFSDPRPSVSMNFQCCPLAFLAEQCGGKASDGFTRILDIEPTSLFDRVPFFCGSKRLVERAEHLMAAKKLVDGGWCFQKSEPSLPLRATTMRHHVEGEKIFLATNHDVDVET